MNIINDFFKGGGIYNKVSFAIGVLSLIFSVISYYSANKAKANASNAADMAKQVSGKLDILENQLAYTNKLNMSSCLNLLKTIWEIVKIKSVSTFHY